MTSLKTIVENAGWNIVGTMLPLFSAILAVPFLVDRIGLERFGILSVFWILIGYFTFFDLGLGRAVTKIVAELIGQDRHGDLVPACSTAIVLLSLLGLLGGLLVLGTAGLTSGLVANYSIALRVEVVGSAIWIALAVPLVVVTSGLRGILEGFQKFRLLNLVRVPAGVMLFVAPCLAAWFTPSLAWAAASLMIARACIFVAHLLPVRALVQVSVGTATRDWSRRMLRFGGWVAVSNVIGPVIVYADRIIIASLVSATALAYYSAPFEMVARMLVLPTALTAALFPALALVAPSSLAEARKLRRKASLIIVATVAPIAVVGAGSAHLFLMLWLGSDFATNATSVMQILFLGFLFNSLAQVPFSALHSYGVARQPALIHVAELPVYLTSLVLAVKEWGLEGAAWAWTIRALVDYVLMSSFLMRWERRPVHVPQAS